VELDPAEPRLVVPGRPAKPAVRGPVAVAWLLLRLLDIVMVSFE
jgi:hypothetical protein